MWDGRRGQGVQVMSNNSEYLHKSFPIQSDHLLFLLGGDDTANLVFLLVTTLMLSSYTKCIKAVHSLRKKV